MKRVVAFGVLAAVAVAVSCGGDERRSRRGGGGTDAGEGGAGAEGAEGGRGSGERGGEATGGSAGSGVSGAGGGGTGGGAVAGRGGGGAGTSGNAGNAGIAGTAGRVPCGIYDCARLPNVRPGAAVECRNGGCYIPPEGCADGFAHCTTNSSVGCETDIKTAENCGGCGERCMGALPVCSAEGSSWACVGACREPTPDYCGGCVDLDTDVTHCGACGIDCTGAQVPAECMNRQCVATGACYEPFGDCDTEFGCETLLQTPEHCGACGRDCGATNAAPECSSLTTCANPTCNAGYGNCDRASLDCEATYGAACFPDYAGTRRIALGPIAAAVATGGSFTVGGNFTGEVDFDPSLGVDRLYSVYEADAYVTRHDANGAYAWTRAVASGYGYESVTGLSMTPDGSTIATGVLSGPADLDPGPAVDEHSVYGVFVSKLSPAGIRDWARVIGGVNLQVSQLSTDAAGAVYVSGWFAGQVDLDPGPGQDLHEASALNESGFLVKLDASGNFVWSKLVEGEHGGQRWLGVSVAPDGSVWGLGSQVGSATIGETTLSATRGFFLAAFEASGAFRRAVNFDVTAGAWLPASIAAGAGAIHFNAISWGEDLDPGAGRVFRYGEGPNAVLVTLDDTAAYRDAHLYPAYSYLPELATTSGGGALLGLPDGELRAYYTDGVSSWTLAVGDTFTLNLLASSSTHFIVVGNEYGTADYDPGAGTDAVYPGTLLVTRYAF